MYRCFLFSIFAALRSHNGRHVCSTVFGYDIIGDLFENFRKVRTSGLVLPRLPLFLRFHYSTARRVVTFCLVLLSGIVSLHCIEVAVLAPGVTSLYDLLLYLAAGIPVYRRVFQPLPPPLPVTEVSHFILLFRR